jgi:hypothetical protein
MNHPIYAMATVTSIIALAAFGGLLWQIGPRDGRRTWLFAMLATGCLMSPAAFYGVRVPLLIGTLDPIFKRPEWDGGGWSIARDAIKLAYAPITEEPAKLLPWLLLLAFGAPLWPARRMVAPLALAAGLGFAVGEIWLVARLVAQANDPKLAELPWYSFGGFLSERLLTCLSHALFALPTVRLARGGWRWGVLGLALGMLLHGLSNSPILLMHRGVFGWKPEVWGVIVQLWVLGFFVAGFLALMTAHFGRNVLRKILATRMICPGCGAVYRQPLFMGFNFGMSRYERCGVCRKWHWVTIKNLAPLKK